MRPTDPDPISLIETQLWKSRRTNRFCEQMRHLFLTPLLLTLLVVGGCRSKSVTTPVPARGMVQDLAAQETQLDGPPNGANDASTTKPTIRSISEPEAIAIAKTHLRIQLHDKIQAEFEATRIEDGYRIFVTYGTYDESGKLRSFPGGHCTVTISHTGEVVDFVGGL